MQNKSILSIAILKANWDVKHIDYVENFIPFFLHLINIKKYEEIKIEIIKTDFEKEFGLRIPYHPVEMILIRIKNKGYLTQGNQKFYIKDLSAYHDNFSEIRDQQIRELSTVTSELIDFCKKNYSVDISTESAENCLLSFFKEDELSLLSSINQPTALPHVEGSKTDKFYTAKFIQYAKEKNQTTFGFLVNLSVGAALADAIVYGQDFQKFGGKFQNLNLYLDTGYIFGLLGVNGKEKEEAFSELTKTLNELDANLFIFEHTKNEVQKILTSALYWMSSGNYDIQKASRVLKYFIEYNYRVTDIEMFIANVTNIFSEYKIQVVPKPDYEKNIHYQIDEAELKRQILESYKSDPFFDSTQKDETINNDIDSIYSICKLRKGNISFSLKEASHIFITTNKTIARISMSVQTDDNAPYSIPPCITDVLIGTLVWLQNPLKTLDISGKKLMAEAYAAIQPDKHLMKRYFEELEMLKTGKKITEDMYFVLRTDKVAFNALVEKTKNDNHNFDKKTTKEIMDKINADHLVDLKHKVEIEQQGKEEASLELSATKKLLKEEEKKTLEISSRHNQLIELVAKWIAWLIIPFFLGVIIWATYISFFPGGILSKIIAFVVILIATIFGFSIKGFKITIQNKVQNILNKKFED